MRDGITMGREVCFFRFSFFVSFFFVQTTLYSTSIQPTLLETKHTGAVGEVQDNNETIRYVFLFFLFFSSFKLLSTTVPQCSHTAGNEVTTRQRY